RSTIAQDLISAGANVNQRDKNGTSPLMQAVWSCNRDMVRNLMKAGGTVGPGEWMQRRPPRYEDFLVRETFHGKQARVDLRSNSEAQNYRTRLRAGANGKPNFGGHYFLVDWGCGSSCQSYMLVDAITGKVFDGFGAERGADFRPDSSLVIVDPPYPNGTSDDPVSSLPIRYLKWEKDKFVLLDVVNCSAKDDEEKCGCENVRDLLFQPK